jgi:hypothetical protein
MKVVINERFGGFGLSHKAVMRYAELKGITLYAGIDEIAKKVYGDRATLDNPDILIHYTYVPYEEYNKIADEESKKPAAPRRYEKSSALYFSVSDIPRNDPLLIQIIQEMGDGANSRFSQLKIIDIPDDVEWEIEEYDGNEWVSEKHRRWN